MIVSSRPLILRWSAGETRSLSLSRSLHFRCLGSDGAIRDGATFGSRGALGTEQRSFLSWLSFLCPQKDLYEEKCFLFQYEIFLGFA